MNFNEVFYLRKCKKYYDLRITNYKTDFFDSMLGLRLTWIENYAWVFISRNKILQIIFYQW